VELSVDHGGMLGPGRLEGGRGEIADGVAVRDRRLHLAVVRIFTNGLAIDDRTLVLRAVEQDGQRERHSNESSDDGPLRRQLHRAHGARLGGGASIKRSAYRRRDPVQAASLDGPTEAVSGCISRRPPNRGGTEMDRRQVTEAKLERIHAALGVYLADADAGDPFFGARRSLLEELRTQSAPASWKAMAIKRLLVHAREAQSRLSALQASQERSRLGAEEAARLQTMRRLAGERAQSEADELRTRDYDLRNSGPG
jgi:hypothetical protein